MFRLDQEEQFCCVFRSRTCIKYAAKPFERMGSISLLKMMINIRSAVSYTGCSLVAAPSRLCLEMYLCPKKTVSYRLRCSCRIHMSNAINEKRSSSSWWWSWWLLVMMMSSTMTGNDRWSANEPGIKLWAMCCCNYLLCWLNTDSWIVQSTNRFTFPKNNQMPHTNFLFFNFRKALKPVVLALNPRKPMSVGHPIVIVGMSISKSPKQKLTSAQYTCSVLHVLCGST